MQIQHVKYVADGAAITFSFASFLDLAPKYAAALSIIWLLIQIGDWIYKKYIKCKKQKDLK